jgi:tRNA A-37 threonylcarbamoyl transferase component Bud32
VSFEREHEFTGTTRFVIKRRLGAGGMGVVYEALDTDRQMPVALKTLRSLDEHSLYRFKKEFRSLADVRHPNLVRLGELFREGDQWFFTMELIEGVPFLPYVWASDRPLQKRLSDDADADTAVGLRPPNESTTRTRFHEARLRKSLAQLADGLAALHAAGKIHRDIKPSNVMVTGQGRTVLLDFGLVTEFEADHQRTDSNVVGTAAYMAPEQGAGRALGPPADWYSVGAVLYHALTGKPPFDGASIEVLMIKQHSEPPPPRSLVPAVPADLDKLCTDLLRRDPEQRPVARDVLRRLGAAAPAVITTPSPAVKVAPFVGRSRELLELRAAFEETRGGSGIALFVHGESGLGKSALVRRFVDATQGRDPTTVVLSGRCYEREQMPYKAFDGIVDALSQFLGRLDNVVSALLLPDDAALLARVFPILRRIPAMAEVQEPKLRTPNPQEIRTRAFAALRQMLTKVGRRHPLILYIDDLQWADADSLALLADVMHPPDVPPLFLVATCRTNIAVPGLTDTRHVQLERLSTEEGRALVEMLQGDGSARAGNAQRIATEAEGHPLFIQELVRYAATAPGEALGAIRLDEVLWTRIGRLEPPTRALLEVCVLAGAPLAQRLVGDAAELPPSEHSDRVAQLREAHLVRTGGSRGSDTIEPYHDRIREAVAARLSADVRARHHLRLAAVLEVAGIGDSDPRALVRHLEGGGQKDRAARHALRAARMSAEALAFDQAAELYTIALRLGEHEEVERRPLRIHLADALVNAGRSTEAAEVYLLAADGAELGTRLECQRRAAEQFLISGHIEQGLAALRAVLAEFNVKLPSTPARAVASVLWHRLRVRLRGLRWKARDEIEIPQRELTRLDIYRAVGIGLGVVDTVRGADMQCRGLLLALKIGERRRVGRSIAFEATYLGSQGRKSLARSRRLLALADEIAQATGDPYLVAWVRGSSDAVTYLNGGFIESATPLGAAADMFRDATTGANWEMSTLRVFRMYALRQIGEHIELRRSFDEYVRDAARRGDRYSETTIRRSCNLIWLMEDAPEQAREDLDRTTWTPPEGGYHLQHWYELRARAEIDLYEGRAKEAMERSRPGLRALDRSLLTRIQIVRAETRWFRGKLLVATGAMGEVAGMIRKLEREKLPYAFVWAGLLRAAVAFARLAKGEAASILRDTARLADENHMCLAAAVARYRTGDPELVEQAEEWMKQQGIRNPARIADVVAPMPPTSALP